MLVNPLDDYGTQQRGRGRKGCVFVCVCVCVCMCVINERKKGKLLSSIFSVIITSHVLSLGRLILSKFSRSTWKSNTGLSNTTGITVWPKILIN